MSAFSIELGELVDIVMGQAPPGSACNKEGTGTIFVKAGEFQERIPLIREWTTRPLKMAAPDDSLVCVVGATAGKVNYSAFECAIGRSVAAVRPQSTRLDPQFLYRFLQTKIEQLRDRSQGAAQGVITREMLQSLRLVVPPLPEQRRIAAILDKAEALRTKRRDVLARFDRLARSIFVEMFGDPATNAKGWPMVSVGDVADVQGGLQVTSARKTLPVEIRYLRVANVYRGRLQLDEVKTIRATANEVARTKLLPHDMLVVEGHGNPEEVGRGALWSGEIEECVHQNHLIRVRFDLSKVAPTFVCEYLNSPAGRRHLLRAGKTTSGLNTISVSNVRAAPIALPPLAAQKAFEHRLREVGRLKALHQSALETTDALFESLQHGAFRRGL